MPVALKIIRRSKLGTDRQKKWMKREISVHTQLSQLFGRSEPGQPSIARLYDAIENPKYIVMIQEVCELGSVLSYIKQQPS